MILFLKKKLNPEFVNQLKRIEKMKEKIDTNKMFYKGYRKTYLKMALLETILNMLA